MMSTAVDGEDGHLAIRGQTRDLHPDPLRHKGRGVAAGADQQHRGVNDAQHGRDQHDPPGAHVLEPAVGVAIA